MSRRSEKLPRGARRLFRLPGSRARMLRDLDEEMQSHLAMRIEELRALGMSDADAETEALRRFGDTDEFRDYAERRAARKASWLRVTDWFTEMAQDVRHAVRLFRKAPGFTAIAVLTLALGIGANTAIFSVVHHLLLAPLPYPNGNRIVMPMQEDQRSLRTSADRELVLAWQERARSVSAIAGAGGGTFSVQPDGTVEMIPYALITSNFLQVLGVQPSLGRAFTPDEEAQGGAAVAMLSYGRWQLQGGGRADVIGSTLEFEGKPYTIVGVMPPGLTIPLSEDPVPELWFPADMKTVGGGSSRWPQAFGMLRPGVSAEVASRELQAIAASLPERARKRLNVRAMRAQDFLGTRETRSIQVLFVAVGGLLLIACANVANLMLARAATRRREFAVRVALGAGRARLARQVLTESVLLATVGGILGIVVAWQTLRIIVALRPPSLEHLAVVGIEPAVLLWSAAISMATGILFGCVPALLAGARKAGELLRSESRTGSAGMASRRIRSALIVFEIAMSLVLLVGSGLLVRSFAELQRMPLGFEPRGLVYTSVIIGGPRMNDVRLQIREGIIERLRALPGVTGAAIGTMPGKGFFGGGVETEPDASGTPTRAQSLGTVFLSSNYFQVAGIHLVAGRMPDPSLLTPELNARPIALSPEVVVNRELAQRLFPRGNAVGSRVRTPPREGGMVPPGRPGQDREEPWMTIVGVADDTRMPGLHGDLSWLQLYSLTVPRIGDVPFLVRVEGSGEDAAPTIQRAIASVDRRLVIRPMLAGETYLRDSLAPTRFAMALLTAFAVIALLLAAAGLYGVIAYSVSQRTREIGIRVALGAEPRSILSMVLGGGLRLAAVGVLVGAVVAAGATRVLGSMLYGVSPGDPATFVAIALLVAIIAVVASYVPARRALRVDPLEALREI